MPELKNAQHEIFCREYIVTLNASDACIKAGYSTVGANSRGSKLTAIDSIKARIIELKAERVERLEIDADDIARQLESFRSANISEYVELMTEIIVVGYDDNDEEIKKEKQHLIFKDFSELTEAQLGCIESIKYGKHGLELRLQGKEWTIEKLNRHIGFYEKDHRQSNKAIVITGIDINRTGETTSSD